MGILDNLERGLERVVNGAFAKTFRSGLQPVEITAALRREMDTKAAVVSRDRVLVPNNFTVRLSTEDYARMAEMGPTLIEELIRLVNKHASTQHYQFAGGITVTLEAVASLAVGVVEVTSESVSGAISWSAVLEINGVRHPLTQPRTIIGRGSDADITVDDSSISRKHVEIVWDGVRTQANDLGSTNGTTINGQRLVTSVLEADSVLQLGQTTIVLRLTPQAADASAKPASHDGFWGPQ